MPVDALDEELVATIDGERREITKREAVVTQLVNESAGADLRATKLLIDMPKDVEKTAGMTPPPEPAPFAAADEKVMANFIARTEQDRKGVLPLPGPPRRPLREDRARDARGVKLPVARRREPCPWSPG
jgi:hypothetical protein